MLVTHVCMTDVVQLMFYYLYHNCVHVGWGALKIKQSVTKNVFCMKKRVKNS